MTDRDYMIRQISVFLENRPGALAEVTRYLADHEVNMRGFSVAESRDFGAMRIVVDDPGKAGDALSEGGYNFSEVDVMVVEMPDRPGGLADVTEILSNEFLNIEYAYIMALTRQLKALVVLRVDDMHRAVTVLNDGGSRVLTRDEIKML